MKSVFTATTLADRPSGIIWASLWLPARRLANMLVLAAGDGLALLTALAASQLVRWMIGMPPRVPIWFVMTCGLWWLAAAGGRLLPGWGLGIVRELRRIVLLLPVVVATSVSLAYFMRIRSQLTRLELGTTLLASLVLVPYVRTKVKYLLIRLRLWGMLTVVYGDLESARAVITTLKREPGLGYIPVAVCDESSTALTDCDGVPIVGPDTAGLIRASTAIVASASSSLVTIPRGMVTRLSRYRHVLVVPNLSKSPSLWVQARDLGGILGLEISQNLADPWLRAIKRTFELGLVVITFPLWVPAVTVLALALLLFEKHPPFFGQKRIGRDGKTFLMWKLRTMRPDAEAALERRLQTDEQALEEWSGSFKLRDDPRITRFGRVLRRSSLDELPQLWNVLKGEMSLVGPRPLPAYHHRRVTEPARSLRENVCPGITGLWQVSGRSNLDLEGLAEHDTYYVRNWSIWLDLVILVRTWRALISRTGAY